MTHQDYMNKKGHLLNVLRDADTRGDFYLEHDCVDELNLLWSNEWMMLVTAKSGPSVKTSQTKFILSNMSTLAPRNLNDN